MTDHPTPDPTPDDGAHDADARWFRAAVDPVLDAHPVPDDWTAVRDRVAGSSPLPVPLPRTATRRGLRPWALAAAAAIAAVAGFGATLALTGDDDSTVSSDAGGRGGATGFYVPSALPDGWEVTSLYEMSDQFLGDLCPCDLVRWEQGPRRLLALRVRGEEPFDPAGPAEGRTYLPFVRGEVPASSWAGAPEGSIGWEAADPDLDVVAHAAQAGDVTTYVIATGVAVEGATAEAEALALAVIDGDLATPPGYDEQARNSVGEDVRLAYRAEGTMRNDELDLRVPFSLGPDPLGLTGPLEAPRSPAIELPGSDRSVTDAGESGFPSLAASWPGVAGFQIGNGLAEGATSEGVTTEQLVALADAFRPATAEEWAAFVETSADDDSGDERRLNNARAALARPTLLDLIVRDGEQTADEELGDLGTDGPPRDGGDEGDEPVPTAPSPELPGELPTPTVLAPGPDLPYDFEHVAFEASWDEAPARGLAPGQPFTLVVTLTNPTDRPLQVSPCFPTTATWRASASSADPPTKGGGSFDVPCDRTEPDTLAPGEVRTLAPPDAPDGFPFTAPTLEDLGGDVPPGLMLAEIDFGPDPQRTVGLTYVFSREG